MTLVWGMTYQAMGGGKQDAALANAFAQVLGERISVKPDEHGKESLSLRLAPGQMPVKQAGDGSLRAPLAHVFEALLGSVMLSFHGAWSVAEYYDVLSNWVALVDARGTPLDEAMPIDDWLVSLAKAGQLEAYTYQLLGAAFPLELKAYAAKHAPELKAYKAYLKTAALSPKRVAEPDDLIRVK
jgi:hypothetical protein